MPVEQSEEFNVSSSSLADLSEEYSVRQFVNDFQQHSLMTPPEGHVVKEYHTKDLSIGGVIRRGTFGSIYRVKIRNDNNGTNDEGNGSSSSTDQKRSTNVELKRIDSVLQGNRKVYMECALNMANEVKILTCLRHRNVIQLIGVHAGDMVQLLENKRYFLLLEAITSTLEDQLDGWLQHQHEGGSGLLFSNHQNKKQTATCRVRDVALGVASAVEYLHSNSIAYRDVRPRSVGFNTAGHVKLINFSRARNLDVSTGIGEQLQFCGRPPYVAPEVVRGQWYDERIDVFSFGMLLWEVLTLQKPFYTLMHEDRLNEAIVQGKRPQINSVSSRTMRNLIKECWVDDPNKRPSFSSIRGRLQQYVDDDDSVRDINSQQQEQQQQQQQESVPDPPTSRLLSPFGRRKSASQPDKKRGILGMGKNRGVGGRSPPTKKKSNS